MAAATQTAPGPAPPRRAGLKVDRQLGLALVVAALVVAPRSALIATAHSETYDVGYHLTRGLAYLTRSIAARDLELNDPPLGEGLVALPVLATNLLEGRAADDDRLYDAPGRAERIALRVALWNSALALPLFATVFLWARALYGLRSAWLATAALLVEPTLAAHLPLATLDVLGVTGIVVACRLAWRYFERPSPGRLAAVGASTGVALMLKHTDVLLPAVLVGYAGLWWVVRPWLDRAPISAWWAAVPGRLRACVVLPIYVAAAIWALTLFEMVPPKPTYANAEAPAAGHRFTAIQEALRLGSPWPAGAYLRAFRSAFAHGLGGHEGYLFGERSLDGWRSYFLVAAWYKVPIGLGLVLALGMASLAKTPPRWGEWGLFLPLLGWALFLINSKMNIGFRHFLPPLVLGLALASRCLTNGGRPWSALAWLGVSIAAVHGAGVHPDYLSDFNYPRHKPYLAISDSNVDWGQSLKQVRLWVDSRPDDGKAIHLRYFGDPRVDVSYYLGDRVAVVRDGDAPPASGWLVVSPVAEAGVYERDEVYRALQPHEPDAVIGHSMLAYDLDRLGGGPGFRWPPTGPGATERVER